MDLPRLNYTKEKYITGIGRAYELKSYEKKNLELLKKTIARRPLNFQETKILLTLEQKISSILQKEQTHNIKNPQLEKTLHLIKILKR